MQSSAIKFNSKTIKLGLMAVLSLPVFSGAAFAEEDDDKMGWFIPKGTAAKNFYAGVGVGASHNNSPHTNQDGSVTGVNTDKSDLTKGLFFGYQVNDNVAVEAGYEDLGESEFSGTSDGSGPSWAAGSVKTVQEADGWELGVTGRWPVSSRWYALGYVGMFWWDAKETYYENGIVSVAKESGSDMTYALGFEFDHGLKDRIVYRFMGKHHEVGNDDYDVNTATAEVIYRFP